MKKTNVLALALAAGLILPMANVEAGSLADDNFLDFLDSMEVGEEREVEITLEPDSPLITSTTVVEEKEDEVETEETDEAQKVEETDEQSEEDIKTKEQEIVDMLNKSTEKICGLDEDCLLEDNGLRAQAIEQAYIFNGKSLPIQTIQIVDGEKGPVANVVSIREYAYILNNSDLQFDVKTDGNKFYVEKGKNYNAGTTKKFLADELANAYIEEFTGSIIVDGVETEVTGYIVDGEPMIRASLISNALDFRFRNDVKDQSKLLINSDKSDIAVPTVEELDEEIKKADYTLLFNWGPWCPWSKHELPIMEQYAQYLMEQRAYNIQVLGLVNKSQNYTNEEISVLFDKNKSIWKNYGTDDAINKHLSELLEYRLAGFPTSFIVDKDLKKVGEEFYTYYEEFINLYLADNQISEDEYEEGSTKDDEIKRALYSNFLDYAIKKKEVKLSDLETNVLKEVKIDNKDKAGWEKVEKDLKASETKEEVKENKAPAKAAKVTDNPKTGVGSVAGAIAMAAIAAAALKKTKK